ncbi:hypothetical protein BKA93DRAFT_560520 [Sparassis latifolia]
MVTFAHLDVAANRVRFRRPMSNRIVFMSSLCACMLIAVRVRGDVVAAIRVPPQHVQASAHHKHTFRCSIIESSRPCSSPITRHTHISQSHRQKRSRNVRSRSVARRRARRKIPSNMQGMMGIPRIRTSGRRRNEYTTRRGAMRAGPGANPRRATRRVFQHAGTQDVRECDAMAGGGIAHLCANDTQ